MHGRVNDGGPLYPGPVHRIFVDSNVLGSRTQYDWLFMLKLESRIFAIVTSTDVLDEAHRVWRRSHPSVGGNMRKRREQLFRECFDDVIEDWAGGDASTLADIHDTHVHNAATHSGADILLTNNVSDFGDPALLSYDLYTPDEFFTLINNNHPHAVRNVTRDQVKYWMSRRDAGDKAIPLTTALQNAGCPAFADAVAVHLEVLSG